MNEESALFEEPPNLDFEFNSSKGDPLDAITSKLDEFDSIMSDNESLSNNRSDPPSNKDADASEDTKMDHIDHETESVSEDELPTEAPKPTLDTEAVSDEELPGIPDSLDTEAVSDDELPPIKSGKRSSSADANPEKKMRTSSNRTEEKEREEEVREEKRSSKRSRSVTKSKQLPELAKYWRAVRQDPTDFTGWTYLLQYVDQETDVVAARNAYDAFLSHYPYCYGYWRKYADYEKRRGDKAKCEEVFERGLNAIPLSVDLWLHYLNFCKTNLKDDEPALRAQFEKAVDKSGLEFRSDRLWDFYIKWESDLKNYQNVLAIYDRLLKIPVQGYKTHFENFEDFVRNHPPNKILSVDEFLSLRAEVVQKIKEKGAHTDPIAAPPGDELESEADPAHADEETALMREKIVNSRKKLFKTAAVEVSERINFEEGIKRPYFHVKPLERCQLNTWRDYLDFEIKSGDLQRIVILFERCLIACALYEEFWIKYIKFLESVDDSEELIRNVYRRACLIHHPKKPFLALGWATFEESAGNIEGARQVLEYIEKHVPNLMLIYLRRINLERRVGNFEEVVRLYELYIDNSQNKTSTVTLCAKYARFCWKILNDLEKAIGILQRAINKFGDETRLYVLLFDLLMVREGIDESECLNLLSKVIETESIIPERRLQMIQRKIEFIEDFGSNINNINKDQVTYMALMRELKEQRKHMKTDGEDKTKGKGENPPVGSSSSSGYSSYNYSTQGNYGNSSYSQQYTTGSGGQFSDQNPSYQNWNYSQNYSSPNQSWGGYNYYS